MPLQPTGCGQLALTVRHMTAVRIKNNNNNKVKLLTKTELDDANLIQAINKKVIPVAAYAMNVCKFSTGELNELDQVIKRELRQKNMLGRQASDERLYLTRAKGGRGLKSLRDTYKETRLRVACYMVKSANPWIKAAWRREMLKEENTIIVEFVRTMEEVGVRMRFEGNSVQLDEELIENDWKPTWSQGEVKIAGRCRTRKRVEAYETKEQQGRLFREQEKECNLWLTQNVNPRKTASIMVMLEHMVETRVWKAARGLIEDGRCQEQVETVEHLVAGCKVLANTEYLTRHNRAMMIMAVAWARARTD